MTKERLLDKAKAMISAPSCCAELKAAGQAWIDSVGKADEHEKAKNLIAEIKDDITTAAGLVEFAHSPMAEKIFGEGVKDFRAHADELKTSGAEYCDCGACSPAKEILDNKAVILS